MNKVYRRERKRGGCRVTVEPGNRDLSPRLDLANHSPTGFEWGYGGSGPAQLALAILADFVGDNDERVLDLYQEFKRDMIADLPADRWVLGAPEIAEWLRTQAPPISQSLEQ